MSVMMALEIESGVVLEDIVSIWEQMDIEVELGECECSGYLPESYAGFSFTLCPRPRAMFAEGMDVDWSIGMLATFHIRAGNMMIGIEEIYRFIKILAHENRHRFVLSCQYETIYAVREEGGLQILREIEV